MWASGRARMRTASGSSPPSIVPLGYEVVTVPVTRVLHLKSAVSALPDGTVIGYPPLVDDPSAFPSSSPCRSRTAPPSWCWTTKRPHVGVRPADRATARRAGLEVVIVPITEFEKLEGCVTCLSVRLRDDS